MWLCSVGVEAALAPCQLKLRLCLVSWHGLVQPLQRGSRQQQSPAEASTSSRGRWWCGAASILCVVCTDATVLYCTVLYCTDIQTQDTSRQLWGSGRCRYPLFISIIFFVERGWQGFLFSFRKCCKKYMVKFIWNHFMLFLSNVNMIETLFITYHLSWLFYMYLFSPTHVNISDTYWMEFFPTTELCQKYREHLLSPLFYMNR